MGEVTKGVVAMRGLSLHQPWATLVAVGAKQYETRTWSTAYRGELAIHATQAFSEDCRWMCLKEPFYRLLVDNGLLVPGRGQVERRVERLALPRGAILAVAELVVCVPTEECTRHSTVHFLSAREQMLGDFAARRFAWKLADVRQLPEPIPCRGAQGLWTVPAEIEAEVRRYLDHASRRGGG